MYVVCISRELPLYGKMAVADSLDRISSLLKRRLEEVGLEAYPFKVSDLLTPHN